MQENKEQLRLSVSKSKCFEQCKKQFQFSYIQKLPKKERDYHIFGKFCHKVLEDFHKAFIDGSTEPLHKEMSKAFKAAKAEYKDKMTVEMTKECFDILHEYLKLVASGNSKYNTMKNVLSVEKEFFLPISDKVILNGLIDKIQLDDDNVLHVADYKSTKNKKYLKNDFFQLLTYAYTMLQEDTSIKKIRASYILLRHDFEYITTEFNVDQIMSIKDKYLEYANAMMNETEYKANPTVLCGWCDYLDICQEGQLKVKPQAVHGAINW